MAVALHRITRGYGVFGVVVPVVGIALALVQGRMGEIWINIAMILTARGRAARPVHLSASTGRPRRPRRRRAAAHPEHARRNLQPAVGDRRGPHDRPSGSLPVSSVNTAPPREPDGSAGAGGREARRSGDRDDPGVEETAVLDQQQAQGAVGLAAAVGG
ncbi:hypothetical protein ACFQX6_16795 [Streptosporangium lutulentum]